MKGKTILLVEDDQRLSRDVVIELEASGYKVVAADDGKHALEIIREVKPDAIISDVMMPEMDGHEMLKRLRVLFPSMRDVPFIFLTALGQRSDVMTGRALGAHHYLVKPVDLVKLSALLDQCLAVSR